MAVAHSVSKGIRATSIATVIAEIFKTYKPSRSESSASEPNLAAVWGQESHLEACYLASAVLLLFLLVHMVS
jgi:hypothetical protein